ncbi:hypothetical protein COCSADRAFT_170295 [Bipolaris sorokiniana ND90Pr]|uniref:Uncharacterized protein n=1 Tax=Cochliobolus sativus (strain ND90Pr / ATCC 201652) TaxID=665912 RepID=M2T9A5_COCSN|nr:uncharacterized protein COCSADRAFT_170295 [Bipolaris sorokiniana ND90Pr]EMD65831.1 hypothetical protein COCSADRAFT_170295 [Bipolaris sorokiniana ND90Pr]
MASFVSFSLAICFVIGPILSSTLTYLDIRNLFRAETQVSEYDYRWERIIGIFISTSLVGLAITGLIAIATEPYPIEIYTWLDALARMLQIFIFRPWNIWAVHLVAILAILDIASAVTGKAASPAYESALLTRFGTVSLFSLGLSYEQLEIHKNSGSDHRDEEYMRLLHTFVFTNAAAASSQLCGAIITFSFAITKKSTSTKLRQGILMLLCYLPYYVNRIWPLSKPVPEG